MVCLQLPKRKQALQELASETTRLQSLTRSQANFLPVSALQRYALLASTFREDYTVAAVAVDDTPPKYAQDVAHAFVCLMTAAVEVAPASVLDPRLLLMTALVALWGGRLTFNFARKGGYRKGGEDYRWAVVRRRMPTRAFAVFNVLFIAGYQNLLLLLISLPACVTGPSRLRIFFMMAK